MCEDEKRAWYWPKPIASKGWWGRWEKSRCYTTADDLQVHVTAHPGWSLHIQDGHAPQPFIGKLLKDLELKRIEWNTKQ